MELHVDLDALQDVGREVQSLLGLIGDDACFGPADADGLGGADIAGAVDRFRAGWLTDRRHMTEQVQACLDLVELAVERYSQTERTLQNAAGSSLGETS